MSHGGDHYANLAFIELDRARIAKEIAPGAAPIFA